MENIRKIAILLALCLVLCTLPVASAHAAEEGNVWLRYVPGKQGVMAICADKAVASGVITITYNAEWMTFQSVTVDSAYVLAYAVNDKETGKLQISWIAPKDNAAQGGHVLMFVEFVGISDDEYTELVGSVQNVSGEAMAITKIDLHAALDAESDAENLKAEDYTADSFAPVQAALKNVIDLLDQVTTTQAQLDAATQALVTAMENLVVYTPEPPPTEPPATEPTPTEPAPTEPAPTEPKPSEKPTQPGSQPKPTEPVVTDPVPKKNDTLLIVGVALALCAVVAIAAVVILKKRGRK